MIKLDNDSLRHSRWHEKVEGYYIINDGKNNISFYITPIVSGCGSVLLSGYCLFGEATDNIRKDLGQVLQKIKDDGVGNIITTLGEGLTGWEANKSVDLIENIFGMTSVLEYNNYRHSSRGKYKQRLYTKVL